MTDYSPEEIRAASAAAGKALGGGSEVENPPTALAAAGLALRKIERKENEEKQRAKAVIAVSTQQAHGEMQGALENPSSSPSAA